MSATKTKILAITAGLLFAAAQAGALGTDAGTDITNMATVDYTVGTVNQPAVNSNIVTFKTDRRILVTVAEIGGGYTDVTPGDTEQLLTFTVTNDTNGPLDFRLEATNDSTGTTEAHGGSDDFDPTPFVVIVDSNNNGVYDSGIDAADFLDEIAEGDTVTVWIVSTIPFGQLNDETAGLTLTAYAAQAGGAGLGADWTESASETDTVVDTVFGDIAGDTGDVARDGKHSDDDAYRVRTATLAVTKTSRVVSDPYNGTTDPKRIPGAVIEYCVTVENTGDVAALDVALTDVLTGQPVTYQAGSIFTVDSAACTGGVAEDDDATGADELPNGGAEAGGTVSATFSTISPATGKAMRFQVMINN
jgi:uncharacterized repeat protein (TIGR01451 family)